MPTMQVTPQFINPPKPGGKMGNIKLPDGTVMFAMPAVLNQMKAGGTYEATYSEPTPTFDKMKITAVRALSAAPPPAARSGGKYGGTDDVTAERIFVCGALNAYIGAGSIGPNAEDVAKAVNALRKAWALTFGRPKSPEPTTRTVAESQAELNDEIPF